MLVSYGVTINIFHHYSEFELNNSQTGGMGLNFGTVTVLLL